MSHLEEKPCEFKKYKEVYERFWSDKKSVTPDDIEFMIRLINERSKPKTKKKG